MSSFFEYPVDARTTPASELAFLAGRPPDDLRRIAHHADRIRFAAGDTVLRLGDRDRALYLILSGELEALVDPPSRMAAGSVFGEVAFLDGRPRSASVRAVSDGEALRLSFEEFEILAARHSGLGRAILLDLGRILAARLRRATEVAR
jgi:CRP/FNR family cyclic AMP-dependent transcriptional regulator